MIRVLHIFHQMANGGVEHFVMNFYRNIDRSEVQFDFLTSVESDGFFDEEIRALGGKLYRAYPLKKNPIRNYFDIAHIVQKNHYDIVHRHTGSAFGYFDLRAARHGGAKYLILHSHNPQAGKPILHSVFDMFLKFDCIKFACSREAGEFLFGTGAEFEVMNNAIDCDKFEFDPAIRAQVREELGIADSFVMGHIGRFEMQKNHEKLFEIFYEILQKRPNSCLVCVGVGSLMDNRKEQAKRMGIYDKVRFLGSRNDVKRIIQAFDFFVFPSKYEGFSITQIEAQVNGLKCFTSRSCVPFSSNITGNVRFIGLEEPAEVWAETILESNLMRDLSAIDVVKNAGYDIINAAKKLTEFYRSLR